VPGDVALAWGWHPDPYGEHEERYISVDGTPTKLVRDDRHESYDPPPDEVAADGQLVSIASRQQTRSVERRGPSPRPFFP
jgi:hypothetical protein